MKKILTVILCAMTALSLTACSADKAPSSPDSSVSSNSRVSSASSASSASSTGSVVSSANVSAESAVSSAESTKYKSLTILGDSIASGCMLPQYEPGDNYSAPNSFGNMLGESFESYKNFAVDGRTTDELLNALQSPDEELAETLSNADVTIISIGGNDFLRPMISAMLNESEFDESRFSEDSSLDISDEEFQNALNSALEAAKGVDVTKTLDNIRKCAELISDINPNTEIILMTVYDPFSGNESLKAASEVAQEKLSLLNFGLTLLESDKVSVIDVYSAFDGKSDKYTNISAMDIHPNADGHNKIYALLKRQLKLGD